MKVLAGLVATILVTGAVAQEDECLGGANVEVACTNSVVPKLVGARNPCCAQELGPNSLYSASTDYPAAERCTTEQTQSDDELLTTSSENGLELDLFVNITAPQTFLECCKSCTCYGDPECVSFNGVQDKWITCDARQITGNSCPMYQGICDGLKDGNGNDCKWIRDDSKNSKGQGWIVGEQGSPCTPDFDAGDTTMLMFENSDIEVTLYLGERGVINITQVIYQGDENKLPAEDCFDPAWRAANAATWTADVENANLIYMKATFGSNYQVSASCIRQSPTGLPRLNIDEFLVYNLDTQGTGFCETGVITESLNDANKEHSIQLHKHCVNDKKVAQQACFELVKGGSQAGLDECGQALCSVLALDGAQTTSCENQMLNQFNNWNTWIKYYCTAIDNLAGGNGQFGVCVGSVQVNGLPDTITDMGDGRSETPDEVLECTDDMSAFAWDETKFECADGVLIETQDSDTGVWTKRLFFDRPMCNPKNIKIGTGFDYLFLYVVRVSEIHADSPKCLDKEICKGAFGSETSLIFTETVQELQDRYKQCIQTGRTEEECMPPIN